MSMDYREAEILRDRNSKTSISKEFKVPFLFGLFTLHILSEDRENGEYKHFVDVYFLGFRMISSFHRTGRKNWYAGSIVKNNIFISFLYDIWDWMQGAFYWSDSVCEFLSNNLPFLVRQRFYNGTRLNMDNNGTVGISRKGVLDGYRDIDWKNNGISCRFTVDDETERLMREGVIYFIEKKD